MGEKNRISGRSWLVGIFLVTVVAGGLRLWMPGPTIVTTDELN